MAAVVFDFGSSSSRIGFAGDFRPRLMFPTLVGRSTVVTSPDGWEFVGPRVGRDAYDVRDDIQVKNPIYRSVIENYDDMEEIIKYSFERLNVRSEERRVLLTESPIMSQRDHDRMVEILLEKFSVPGLYVENQAVLCLKATGQTTGIVVDAGHTITTTVPVHNGRCLKDAIGILKLGGCDIEEMLIQAIDKKDQSAVRPFVTEFKERIAYVSYSPSDKLPRTKTLAVRLRNRPQFEIVRQQQSDCTEIMFHPERIAEHMLGVHTTTFNSITASHKVEKMFNNVILAGGTTLTAGFQQRFEKELNKLAPPNVKVRMVAHQGRRYLAWLGGSHVASEPKFAKTCMTTKDSQEFGTSFFRRKFCCC